MTCAGAGYVQAEPIALDVLLDTSLSMEREVSPGRSRLQVAQSALRAFYRRLPQTTWAGFTNFPNVQVSPGYHGPTACFLPYQAGPVRPLDVPEQLPMLETVLSELLPLGATPTEDAFSFARTQLADSALPPERSLVLITDGPPTCSAQCEGDGRTPADTTGLLILVQRAREMGQPTFVVALGEHADADWLTTLAQAGGTAFRNCTLETLPCHYAVPDGPDAASRLDSALARVSEQSAGCRFRLPQNIDLDHTNLVFELPESDAVMVRASGAVAGDCHGLRWAKRNGSDFAELCPDACQALRDAVGTRVYLMVGCAASPIPRP
ncbi:MAG: vWA domain-containing protein [Polyangiaceae bacterium]